MHESIQLPRQFESIPHTPLKVDEFEALIRQSYVIQNEGFSLFRILRDRAIMYVLYGCGLRAKELLEAKLSLLRKNKITIIGKGNKKRDLFLIPKVKQALDERLSFR